MKLKSEACSAPVVFSNFITHLLHFGFLCVSPWKYLNWCFYSMILSKTFIYPVSISDHDLCVLGWSQTYHYIKTQAKCCMMSLFLNIKDWIIELNGFTCKAEQMSVKKKHGERSKLWHVIMHNIYRLISPWTTLWCHWTGTAFTHWHSILWYTYCHQFKEKKAGEAIMWHQTAAPRWSRTMPTTEVWMLSHTEHSCILWRHLSSASCTHFKVTAEYKVQKFFLMRIR